MEITVSEYQVTGLLVRFRPSSFYKDIPYTEISMKKEIPSRSGVLGWLSAGDRSIGPVRLALDHGGDQLDPVLLAHWKSSAIKFVVECCSPGTPKNLERAADFALRRATAKGGEPLVVAPFIRDVSLAALEARGVSCLDMCGNGVLTSSALYVRCTGSANLFRERSAGRDPYSGDGSVFTRCFLIQPEFATLKDFVGFVRARHIAGRGEDRSLGPSLASKVVSALAEEVVVVKEGNKIVLADRQSLMDGLKRAFKAPNGPSLTGQCPLSKGEMWERLRRLERERGIRSVLSGASSARELGLPSTTRLDTLYVDDLHSVAEQLQIREAQLFPNLKLIQTNKNWPYFDRSEDVAPPLASPIQTWLESDGSIGPGAFAQGESRD